MMKLKKVAAVVASGVLACSLLALSGCGQDSEEVIREGVTEELESLKTLDEATLDELMGDVEASALADFEDYGIDAREFVKAYLAGFDYAVDEVTVDGDAAQVTVTFTCKSFTDLQTVLEASVAELVADPSVASMSADELNVKVGELFMEAVNQIQVRTTDPFVLEYQKTDNVWGPTDGMQDTITSALFN